MTTPRISPSGSKKRGATNSPTSSNSTPKRHKSNAFHVQKLITDEASRLDVSVKMAFAHDGVIYAWNGTENTLKCDPNVTPIQWQKVTNWDKSSAPLKFAAHQVVLQQGTSPNKVLLFGGEHTMIGNEEFKERSCRVFELDMASHCITDLPRQGEFVPGVSGHSAVLYKDALYSFGGMTTDENDDAEVRRFDLDSKTWSLVESSSRKPPLRFNHASVLWEHDDTAEMVILFGCTRAREYLADVWAFDLNKHTWRELKTRQKSKLEALANAAVGIVEGSKVILYGGETAQHKQSNELWMLDLNTMKWTQPKLSGDEIEQQEAPKSDDSAQQQDTSASLIVQGNSVFIIQQGGIMYTFETA